MELSNARGAGGMGPASITYQDINAWSRLTGHRPSPQEVQTLRDLDGLWLRIMTADDPDVPMTEAGEIDRETVAKQTAAAFTALARKE